MKRSGYANTSNARMLACWLLALLLVFLCTGCAKTTKDAAAEQPPVQTTLLPDETDLVVKAPTDVDTLLGFIVPDDGTIAHYTAMHGFLRTAEAMGYPAKLYRANTAQKALEMVDEAIADECAGLLIWNEGDMYVQAVESAVKKNVSVVIPYYETQNSSAHASVVTDQAGYLEEVARVIAERMVERECRAGKILVYGYSPVNCYLEFSAAIKQYYPQYNVSYLTRTKTDTAGAVEELAEHILWNRDIKGLFCIDADGADIAVRARTSAQRSYRNDGAPEQREGVTPTPLPIGATPVPEGLIKSITITVVGTGISEETIELLYDYDIYAFVLEPYYEAAAHSTMVLDQLIRGESVPEVSRLNMPIVRQTTLDKYELIHQQVQEWFDLDAAQSGE